MHRMHNRDIKYTYPYTSVILEIQLKDQILDFQTRHYRYTGSGNLNARSSSALYHADRPLNDTPFNAFTFSSFEVGKSDFKWCLPILDVQPEPRFLMRTSPGR